MLRLQNPRLRKSGYGNNRALDQGLGQPLTLQTQILLQARVQDQPALQQFLI